MPCVQNFQTNFFVLVISSSLIDLWFSYLHKVSAYTYSELPLPIGHAAHVRLGHMPGFSDSSALRENASCVGTCARVSQRTKNVCPLGGGGTVKRVRGCWHVIILQIEAVSYKNTILDASTPGTCMVFLCGGGEHPFGLKSQCRVGGRWGGIGSALPPIKTPWPYLPVAGIPAADLRGVVKDLSFFGGGGTPKKVWGH